MIIFPWAVDKSMGEEPLNNRKPVSNDEILREIVKDYLNVYEI